MPDLDHLGVMGFMVDCNTYLHGGDLASTGVAEQKVHAERVVTLVKQSLQLL